jgi:hypothetical protein
MRRSNALVPVAALLGAIALGACGGGSPSSSGPAAPAPQTAPASLFNGTGTHAVTIDAGQPYLWLDAFRTPHGSIACVISPTGARCAIAHPQWAATRSTCPSATTQVLLLPPAGKPRFDCSPGAAPTRPAKALPYGTVALASGFACQCYTGGVQCGTEAGRHGFFISPPLVRLF